MQNTKIKTIYIHAGMLKTGTSSIQATLAENKELLKKYSVYYPTKIAINHSDFLLPIFLDNAKSFHVEKERNLPDNILKIECNKKKEQFKLELLNVNSSSVVFSAEGLFVFSDQVLRSLKTFLLEIAPNAKIKCVVCIRNTSEYLASSYQQTMKIGYQSRWNKETEIGFSYQEKLKYFESIFGMNDLVVYDFEDAKKHLYGIVGYFVQEVLMLKDLSLSDLKILKDNDSVSDISVNILHYINVVTESPIHILSEEKLKYERYISDTFPLWSLKGEKFKLGKEYVENLYKKLEPELAWIKDRFGIDYNLSNASYTEERYKIPETFFETIKISFPKLSRILRRAFYDWLCEEIEVRQDKKEIEQLEQTKNWIERSFRDTVDTNLQELKEVITNEVNACKAFFDYFKIEGKQNYQLYYHLYLFLKELGEHEAAKVMLQMYYEKNPHYNELWDSIGKKLLFECCKNYLHTIVFNKSNKLNQVCEVFKNTFDLKAFSNKELRTQIALFLKMHTLKHEGSSNAV